MKGHHLGADHQGGPADRGAALMTFWVLSKFGMSLSNLMGAAADNSALGDKLLAPGPRIRADHLSKVDFISLSMALVLGTAGLPHADALLHRSHVQGSPQVRGSRAISLIGLFYLFSLVLGFGAAAWSAPTSSMARPGAQLRSTAAGLRTRRNPCCSGSSRRSRSRRSSRWWRV